MLYINFITLINLGTERMKQCADPIHDYGHVSRVVKYSQHLAKDQSFCETEHQALLIAAWWHDVSRTLTKRPSFILMPLIDDLLSAFTLLGTIIRHRLWDKSSLLAVRIIFCKGTTTGTPLRKILLRSEQQILVDILKDADSLDLLHADRTKQIQRLADSSLLYVYGYKLQAWWFITCRQIKFKTKAAEKQFVKLLKEFLELMSTEAVILWHTQTFGESWVKQMITDIRKLILQFEPQYC